MSREGQDEFVNLLTSHQSVIRAFVISLLPGLSEAEDVIQNTNQVLWAKRDSFTIGTNFKAWALTTARFQVMAMQQKLHYDRRQPLDDDVLQLVADRAEETESSHLNEQLCDLNDCINQLLVRDQELILHRYWNKGTLADYANVSGRSEGALKVSLHRIRESLRTCMNRKHRLRQGLT